jgi:hypothetical protein
MSVLGRLRGAVETVVGAVSRGEAPVADGGRASGGLLREKVHADREDGFVVFHIGMRINAFWKLHRWLPVALVAPKMVRELVADPDSGLLESRTVVGPGIRNVGFVQYWESFEALREYARDGDRRHRPAWVDYYQSGTKEDSAVGIWHETYVVDPDDYETVYNNMPPTGLGAARGSDLVSAAGERETAAGRLGHDGEEDPVVADGGR